MNWPNSAVRAIRTAPWLIGLTVLSACHAPTRAVVSPASLTPNIQDDLDAILQAPTLSRGYWGVVVKSLDTGETIYARNANRLLMPASNMKILTLAVAAEKLGWDFRFETRLAGVGSIANGTLDGDLIVVGSGDPTIVERDGSSAALFADWVAQLRSAGVEQIRGRIVGDDNAFDDLGLGWGWAWDDLSAGYGASVSALQFNDNIAGLTISPGQTEGAQAKIAIDPAETGLEIVNLVRTAPVASPSRITIQRLPGSARLELKGSVALGAAPLTRTASVVNPTQFFVSSLRDALVSGGIKVSGPAVDIDELDAPPDLATAATLVTHVSAPLSVIAIRLMTISENLYAETLLETLGREAGQATADAGLAVVQDVLQQWGVSTSDVLEADGSGLSRYNYVTPAAITDVLVHIDRDERLRGPFLASLPAPGHDGTLDGRLGRLTEGNLRAKTGSMTGVRALSGYLTTAGGRRLVFSILGNNFDVPGSAIDAAIDAFVERLATLS